MDGGLALDFHAFTRLFLSRTLLTEPKYDPCQSLYTFTRTKQPRPELIVSLAAHEETVASTYPRVTGSTSPVQKTP